MKFTEADKVALVQALAPAVVALKLTTAPPDKAGNAKKVSIDFAAAVWVRRYAETTVKVCEQERDAGAGGGGGFPS